MAFESDPNDALGFDPSNPPAYETMDDLMIDIVAENLLRRSGANLSVPSDIYAPNNAITEREVTDKDGFRQPSTKKFRSFKALTVQGFLGLVGFTRESVEHLNNIFDPTLPDSPEEYT